MAVAHLDDAVAVSVDPAVVGDDDHRPIRVQAHPPQKLHDRAAGIGVEGRRGLVADQEPWTVDERAGDRDTLLLAAGELGGMSVRLAAEPHGGKHFACLANGVAPPPALHQEREAGVLGSRQRRKQVVLLKDEADHPRSKGDERIPAKIAEWSVEDADVAGRGLEQACDDRDQRRLAAPGRPDQQRDLSRGDLDVDSVEHLHTRVTRTEDLRDARAGNGGAAGGSGYQGNTRDYLKTIAGSSVQTRRMLTTLARHMITTTEPAVPTATCQGRKNPRRW